MCFFLDVQSNPAQDVNDVSTHDDDEEDGPRTQNRRAQKKAKPKVKNETSQVVFSFGHNEF